MYRYVICVMAGEQHALGFCKVMVEQVWYGNIVEGVEGNWKTKAELITKFWSGIRLPT